MEFKFPKPQAKALPEVLVPRDTAIVAFHQATESGMLIAKESYTASFNDVEQITVLTLSKWIRAFYESQ